ncbi:MAG: sensor histidine kinase [Rhodospirillales bacterium]
MTDPRSGRLSLFTGLSGRLLALTVSFVMLAEVLIFVPSVSRFRKVYLEDRIAKANLAILAVTARPDDSLDERLQADLLLHAGAHAVVLKAPDRRMLMLSKDMPPSVDVTFDLRSGTFVRWIREAMMVLLQRRDRVMRIVADAPGTPDATIEVLADEAPMREQMHAFSVRILTLSIIISLITAGLVYFSLQWLMVRPIVQLTSGMMRFRENPEDEAATIPPTGRRDEIGVAQRELLAMQTELRAALRQKTRLAALGAAVAKINHDLRNTLAIAMLASDRLTETDDPVVKRITPQLYNAIDRAVALCGQTLDFARPAGPVVRPTRFRLGDLVAELDGVAAAVPAGGSHGLKRIDGTGLDIELWADREQLHRVLSNLAGNAGEAGARTLRIGARRMRDRIAIDVADDGPGIPAHARAHLFQPFAGSMRDGGTGLGLVIAREIVNAHGGELTLVETGEGGTIFRIDLPDRAAGRSPH